jgi:hypothetical protein
LQILKRVTRALLAGDGKDTSERALKYARRFEELVTGMVPRRRKRGAPRSGRTISTAAWGAPWSSRPGPPEISTSRTRPSRSRAALTKLAEAFTIVDSRNTDTDRARMGEFYRKVNGSEKGLGDLVRQRFRNNPDVVFLSVNTDEDRKLVEPFLKDNGWNVTPYFEDGLSRAFQVSSIPTTIVVDKRGNVFSSMNGFLPDRFVDMLTERIEDALGTA